MSDNKKPKPMTEAENSDVKESDRLDQIREILFGEKDRENKNKFSIIEDLINNKYAQLEKYQNEQFRNLQDTLNQQVSLLRESLTSEESQRRSDATDIRAGLTRMEEKITQMLKETKAELDQQRKAVSEHLSADKVSKGDIASLFIQLAEQIKKS